MVHIPMFMAIPDAWLRGRSEGTPSGKRAGLSCGTCALPVLSGTGALHVPSGAGYSARFVGRNVPTLSHFVEFGGILNGASVPGQGPRSQL